ncbi:hypothetical protein NQ318_022075 [Aromia moschata]|uniref:Uncharacterized protein n=1 Tax=Aromia moschata TaxID=1265417 RepID=A0AAV8Z7K7_9CUCU|nr:hypothetical protein NQ318_022075 [Aromia moschata]
MKQNWVILIELGTNLLTSMDEVLKLEQTFTLNLIKTKFAIIDRFYAVASKSFSGAEKFDLNESIDETWFHNSGYVNSQNMRLWSAHNFHFYIETPLHPQKIGV